MALSKDSQVIEKLNQHNYDSWKFKMNMMLIKEDLSDYITQDPPNPITNEWRKKDNKARAIINLVIDDSQIVHVRNLTTAKQTWDTLKTIHERSNLSSKLYLLRKLYNTKMEEKGNMGLHITKILQIVDRLRAIGEEVTDSHLSAILLCSVPPSFDTLITALEARPENELNPEFIRSKLIDEYQRREENSQTYENHAKAFHINKRRNFSNNYKRENKFCTHCKLKNHIREECWQLKKQHNNNYKPKYQGNKNYRNNSSYCYSQNNEHKNRKEFYERRDNDMQQTTSKMKDLALLTSKPSQNAWIIDSGSSAHITNDRNLFTNITDTNESQVVIANGKSLTSLGSGDVTIKTETSDGDTNKITLKNVLFVPQIETNLFSVNKATQNGCTVVFNKNKCHLMYKGETYLEGEVNDSLYEIKLKNQNPTNYANIVHKCNNSNCIELWHRRMGHKNYDAIKLLNSKELATGIAINACKHENFCEVCTKSKMTDTPAPKLATNRANKPLGLIHTDVCGPIRTPSIGGKIYFVTFIDDFSRYTMIYLLSKKDEVLTKLKEYVSMVSNKFGRKPEIIRSDNGGEYIGTEAENYLKDLGIHHQLTIPRCSFQNGVAERKNRSLLDMARSMLSEANLEHKFWGEAINTANYLQNRLPTKANDRTPIELWSNKRPDLSHLKVFGSKVYAYIDKHNRGKLDERARTGIFVGYDNRSKAYRIYTEGKNIMLSRSVKFLENTNPNINSETERNLMHEGKYSNQNISHKQDSNIEQKNIEIEISTQHENDNLQPVDTTSNEPRRSQRPNKGVPPDRLIYLAKHNHIYEPEDWKDLNNIENPKEKQSWLKATEEEITSLKQNKTWTLVDPPSGKRIIGSKWTFKAKYNSNGDIEKYKARLVAKGFSQRYGEDFYETFAPVVSYTAIRSFLAAAAQKKLKINHLDVKTAFLHGELDEDVYMKQPDGYIIPGEEAKVCKLNKAIYGLKQAARAWHIKIANTLKKLGFTQSTAEQCLFKRNTKSDKIYIIVYVDDILVAGSEKAINEIIKELKSEYEIKDLGEVNYYLGVNIRKTENGSYLLNQKQKIEDLVNRFDLGDAKPCNTPIEPGYHKTNEEENLLPNNHKYRQAIGSLLYIATISRPDICAAINILSRRNEKPRKRDWEQVKRVIKYLKTTKDLELTINPEPEPILKAYADADWAGDLEDRKSTSGNLFTLGKTPIQWSTKKQTSVALSSAEAEYLSAANATQEIMWLIKLLEDLDLPQLLPITLLEDNQSTIKMLQSPKHTGRTKHIEIKDCYIRDIMQKKIINIEYCPTKQMTADVLTKPLPKPEFQRHRTELQLQHYHNSSIMGAC